VSYTEKKTRGGSTYYYRAHSFRDNDKVKKKRIYLGKDLDKRSLREAEMKADEELDLLSGLLSKEEMEELERIKERYRAVPEKTLQNRYEAFVSRFTHDSTAIEGNTLTLQETASLLFERITPSSKELREINEVINHREAFDMILSYGRDINRKFVLDLHELVVRDTLAEGLDDQIGKYREVQVYIRGVDWMPPSPEDVPLDMRELFRWYSINKEKLHPLILASYFHTGFETIHPFVDGNGRVGRLLMNFILHKNGYPMVNIPNSRKLEYYECLERARVDANLRPFVKFIYDLMRESDLLF
jgi:Fic family protein